MSTEISDKAKTRKNLISELRKLHKKVASFESESDNHTKKNAEISIELNRANNILEGTNAGTRDWNMQTGGVFLNKGWAEII